MNRICHVETPLGPLQIRWQSENLLTGVTLPDHVNSALAEEPVPCWLHGLCQAVEAYFDGQPVDFHTVCDYFQPRVGRPQLDTRSLTAFRLAVYRVVSQIPYGECMEYGEVAAAVGRPGAARAVGGAMAANPYPLLVPCHRVLASSGLGGFSAGAGVALKRRMLELEGVELG